MNSYLLGSHIHISIVCPQRLPLCIKWHPLGTCLSKAAEYQRKADFVCKAGNDQEQKGGYKTKHNNSLALQTRENFFKKDFYNLCKGENTQTYVQRRCI